MTRYGRIWFSFLAFAGLTLSIYWSYLAWREHSLEPLSAPVDLTKTGSYTFAIRGVHSSRYHPEFRVKLPVEVDLNSHLRDDAYRELWGDTTPLVRIEITDETGRHVLRDESELTRAGGWIVTGPLRTTEIELYKMIEFDGRTFESYRASLVVVRSSPLARNAALFEIATIKAYVLLLPVLGFLALIAVVVVASIGIGVGHILHWRRQRNSASAAAELAAEVVEPP